MAFVQSPLPQEQQNQQGASGVTTANPLTQLPPQTGGSAGTGGSGQAPGVGSPTQFGTNASKLSDYLAANKDQIQTMGQNIAGTLTGQYNSLTGNINALGQDFGSQVGAGYSAPDKALVDRAASAPSNFVNNPNDVSAFQKQFNDTYSGPANIESYSPYAKVQGDVQSAVQNASLLGSPAGLSTYLQNNVESNATPGQNTLDSVLLQGNPEAQQAVTTAAKPFAGLTDYLSGQAAQSDKSVADAQNAASQAAQYAQNAFTGTGGVVPTMQQNLTNALNTARQQATAYNQEIGTDIPPYQAASQFARQAYGLQTPDFTMQPIGMPGIENVTTPQQAADIAALNMLVGGQALTPVTSGTQFNAPNPFDKTQANQQLMGVLNDAAKQDYIAQQTSAFAPTASPSDQILYPSQKAQYDQAVAAATQQAGGMTLDQLIQQMNRPGAGASGPTHETANFQDLLAQISALTGYQAPAPSQGGGGRVVV